MTKQAYTEVAAGYSLAFTKVDFDYCQLLQLYVI